MSEYYPDAWVLLKFGSNETETIYKVMGGWIGSYTGSDSWRICSGIERIEFDGTSYHIHNHSGSIYHCHKTMERISSLMGSVMQGWSSLAELQPELEVKIEIIDMKEYYETCK